MTIKELATILLAYNQDMKVALLHNFGNDKVTLTNIINLKVVDFISDTGDRVNALVIIDELSRVKNEEE